MTMKSEPVDDVEQDGEDGGGERKKKRQRSPSYPAFNLETCIEKVRIVRHREGTHAAPLEAVVGHWGYGTKSSSGLLMVAAMKKFGLLIEVDSGKARHVRVSETALKIILDEREDSTERFALIRDAALKPEMHRDLWDRYGKNMPSDGTIRTYLRLEKGFTDAAAEQFIGEYKETISFAGLLNGDIIPKEGSGQSPPPPVKPSVGDLVQWDSQGMAQFATPRRVVGLSDDGQFVFVEGTGTGLPAAQVTVVTKAADVPAPTLGKVSPMTTATNAAALAKQDTFTLDEGMVVLQYPASLSKSSFEDLEDWVKLQLRKIGRSIKSPSDTKGNAEQEG
jgi:hypothetical protein